MAKFLELGRSKGHEIWCQTKGCKANSVTILLTSVSHCKLGVRNNFVNVQKIRAQKKLEPRRDGSLFC